MNRVKIEQLTPEVIESLHKWCKNIGRIEFKELLAKLDYDHLNQCWFFWHAGMYHGVEKDGYIHT